MINYSKTAADPKATLNIIIRMVVALLIIPLIVGQVAVASDDVEVIDASHVQRFAMDPFESSEGQKPIFYNDLSDILERFGEPTESVESTFGDRTSDAIMTSHWLQYNGLDFTVIESEDKKHSWPETITISGNTYPLKFGIEIGTAYSEFLDLLQLAPPNYRAKGSPMRLYADIRGYWADFRDQSDRPKYVFANLTVSFFFDAEDNVEKITLWTVGL